jgi:hypothetical protein
LYEGWIELKVIDSLSFKFGRMELSYGNQRLLSNSNWGQTALTHDAAMFRFHYSGWEAEVGGAFNQIADTTLFSTDYSAGGNYKALGFGTITKKVGDLKISGIGLGEGFQKTGTKDVLYFKGTGGLSADFKKEKFGVYAAGYYQMGKEKDGYDLSALYGNLDFIFTPGKKFAATLGAEYFSGSDSTKMKNKKYGTFSAPYGSGHSFNGYMDYFTDFPKQTLYAGLIDGYLKLKYALSEKWTLNLDYHYFMLEKKYIKTSSKYKIVDPYLGSEVDLTATWKISKEVSLNMGYCVMNGTETMEAVKGGSRKSFSNWGYLMLTFKPVLYKKE